MEWYQFVVGLFLVLYGIGSLFSESCLGLICRFVWLFVLIWALNAGNFFA